MLVVLSMDSLLRRISNFLNGYMDEGLVNGLPILSVYPLFRRVSNFVSGDMGEALVKSVVNFINGFFVKTGV